jgi:hypothetical protein
MFDTELVNNLFHWHTMTAMRKLPVILDYAALTTVKCHRKKVEADLFQDNLPPGKEPPISTG